MVVLSEVAIGCIRSLALLPLKFISDPPPSSRLQQHPRPGQPIFPASFWPCLLHPCPSTHSPFSPQRDGLKTQTRACHFLHKRPSVASRCTWTIKPKLLPRALAGPSQTLPSHAPSVPQAPPRCPALIPASLPALARGIVGLLLPGLLSPQTTHGDAF